MVFMIILVAGNVIINISLFKEYYMLQAKKRMRNTSAEIEKVYYENPDSLQDSIEMIDGIWGIWVRIADEDSNLLYTSKPEKNKSGRLSEWAVKAIAEGNDAIEDNGIYFSKISKDENNIVRLVCVTKLKNNDGNYYIILTRSIQSVYENISTANRLVEVTALILVVLGSIFIYYLSKSITKPILEISQHAKEIAKLNFSKKLNIKYQNELGTLAGAINEISEKLSFSIEGLKNDIDDRKALVRNMSHELKTPISAIKGYTEGLKYAVADTPEKMNRYCDVIILECNKMDYLVKQMLELSVMERVSWQIDKSNFQVQQLIDGIQMCFAEQIKVRQIQLTIEKKEDFEIYGDYHLIERAAFNYFENAIRHINDGGIIKITLKNEKDGFLFTIFNSGNCIEEDEMNKIWKVFYKTDKARARGSNNFGVGLAIVKANITLHEGEVGVRNIENGVEFWFRIPSEK